MLIGIFYSQIVESSSLVSVLFREAISHPYISFFHLLVNGFSVIHIMCVQKKIVIERTRDLIYLKFVATDFFPKIISPSAVANSVTSCSPCYSAVSALLMNPLPDRSNYSPL